MENTKKTIHSAVNYFRNELKNFIDTSELEQTLRITFSHYFKLERVDLVLNGNDDFLKADFDKLEEVVTALKTNQPLAQIIGEWEFCGLSLKVNEYTLIPRPETEELVQLIVNENKGKDELSILDIGTGTGCIALSLKKEISNVKMFAFDVSDEALKIANENAITNGLEITFNNVDILNWENQNIEKKYDVIVSNPPYITEKEKEVMHKNVLNYEPHLALFVKDSEPLIFYKSIANFAIEHLSENGKLYFEINENYGQEVNKMLIEKEFKNVNIVKDINEKDRIVYCNV